MQISDAGLALIEQFEGFRADVYKDVVGYDTIGFGHRVLPTDSITPPITRDQATELLRSDAGSAERTVAAHATVDLNQNQFDALCSLVYNVGRAALQNRDGSATHLCAALNRQNWQSAADHFLDFDHAGGQVIAGLSRRRSAERALFLTPMMSPLVAAAVSGTPLSPDGSV